MRKLMLVVCVLLVATAVVAPVSAMHPDHQYPCVGDPPRQSLDPLSPACVPFFGGDNGGVTDQGVTAHTVTLVLYNDYGIDGDMNAPWAPDDESLGHQALFQERDLIRTVKALVRHFEEEFQTYGRTVRIFADASSGGLATPCSGRQGDAAKVQLNYEPFAAIALGGGEMDCFAEYLADRFERPTFMYGGLVDAKLQAQHPGMIWSFMPTLQQEARASAGFLCRKLAGRPAIFTDDIDLRGKTRRIALIYPSRSQRGPEIPDAGRALVDAVRARCDLTFDAVETFVDAGTVEAPNIMARFKRIHISTVICYCIPVQTENAATKFQKSATALAYQPEWYWDSTVAMNKAMWHQLFGDARQRSFGMSDFWRQPEMPEQFHQRAYSGQEPGTTSNTRFSWNIYHALLQAFTAVQVAGPALTTPHVAAGLREHAVSNPSNPFTPLASYDGGDAFVDSFTGWWWDPVGTPPGGREREGCMRMLNEGKAYTAGTWPRGHADLFAPSAPCGAANQTAYP